MAIVVRVYSRDADDFVVVINDRGVHFIFHGVSEFDVVYILQAGGVGVRHDNAIPVSKFKKTYGIDIKEYC